MWTDEKLIKAAEEASTDAISRGLFNYKWRGLTKEGYEIEGYQTNGEISTFYFVP